MILSSRNDDKWFQGRTVFLQDGGREGGGGDEKLSSARENDISANIFFLPYHVCKQFIWSFQTLQTIFFNISHLPAPEKE